jgi:hypothetical protein
MVSCHTSIAQEKGLGRKRQNKRPKMGAFDRYMGTKWWLKDRFLGSRVSESAPIIVGGCGRSGTTLMWTILDTHPNICCGPESSIMRGGALKSGKLAMRFDFDPARIRAMARQADSQTDFIDRFFDEFRARHGMSRWAEKSPRNVHRLAFVRRPGRHLLAAHPPAAQGRRRRARETEHPKPDRVLHRTLGARRIRGHRPPR